MALLLDNWRFVSLDKLDPSTPTRDLDDPSFSELLASLAAASQPARVGRDVLDPFEIFGFYAALDLAKSSGHVADCLRRFGFLPGVEALAAVQKVMAGSQSENVTMKNTDCVLF